MNPVPDHDSLAGRVEPMTARPRRGARDPLSISVLVFAALLMAQLAYLIVPTSPNRRSRRYSAYLAHAEQSRRAAAAIERLATSNDPDSLDEILSFLRPPYPGRLGLIAREDGLPDPWSYSSAIAADRAPTDLRLHIVDALAAKDRAAAVDALLAKTDADAEVVTTFSKDSAVVLGMLGDERAIEPLRARFLGSGKGLEIPSSVSLYPSVEWVSRADACGQTGCILGALLAIDRDGTIRFFEELYFEDHGLDTKYRALEALSAIADDHALPAIVDALVIETAGSEADRTIKDRFRERAAKSIALARMSNQERVSLVKGRPQYGPSLRELQLITSWPCETGVNELFRVIEDRAEPELRASALRGLVGITRTYHLKHKTEEIARRLHGHLTREVIAELDEEVICSYFRNIREIAQDLLLEEFERRDPKTLECVVKNLIEIGSIGLVAQLMELLDHEDPSIRMEAARALWRLDADAAEERFLDMITHETCPVRGVMAGYFSQRTMYNATDLIIEALEACPDSWGIRTALLNLYDEEGHSVRVLEDASAWRDWYSENRRRYLSEHGD